MIITKVTYSWCLEIDGFEVALFEGDATFVVKNGEPTLTNIEADGFEPGPYATSLLVTVELDETNFRYFDELWNHIVETHSEEAKKQADEYERGEYVDSLRSERDSTFRLAAE
jgi:hypothetical protein